MRVALVWPYSLDTPGGVQGQVLGLATELRSLGHHVDTLAPGNPRSSQPSRRGGRFGEKALVNDHVLDSNTGDDVHRYRRGSLEVDLDGPTLGSPSLRWGQPMRFPAGATSRWTILGCREMRTWPMVRE